MAHSDELLDEVTAASHRRNSSAGGIEIFTGRERCGGFAEAAAAHAWADSDATGLTLGRKAGALPASAFQYGEQISSVKVATPASDGWK